MQECEKCKLYIDIIKALINLIIALGVSYCSLHFSNLKENMDKNYSYLKENIDKVEKEINVFQTETNNNFKENNKKMDELQKSQR